MDSSGEVVPGQTAGKCTVQFGGFRLTDFSDFSAITIESSRYLFSPWPMLCAVLFMRYRYDIKDIHNTKLIQQN